MTERATDSEWSPLFALMLEEARRSIDAQRAVHESLRSRGGNLLTYGGAVAALFLGLADRHNAETWLALGAFGVLAILCGFLLLPLTLNVDMNPNRMVEDYIGKAESMDHVVESLALAHWSNFEFNREVLDEHHVFYFAATVVFLVEVGLFAASAVIG